MRILSCATPAYHDPPDFVSRGCDCCDAILWSGCVDSILRPGRRSPSVASVASWRRETERFRRKGIRGPEEVAERPSQVPTEALTRLRRSQAGTSTRGAEGADRKSVV